MKKSYNPSDIHQKEGHEQSKKLYRYISDLVKSLDDVLGCARFIGDLFKPAVQIQRSKFREYCERLIFANPVLHGRKGEELLWRKGFYEVVVTAKRLKKNEYSSEEKSCIENHINVGIGHYHHFIARLEKDYALNLQGTIDFIIDDNSKLKNDLNDNDVTSWANLSVHRCLIYLGDLCRYKLEIYPNWDHSLAVRYYSQALCFKPEYGMPHNQMGTLANNANNSLDATYYYIRSLSCKVIFEGTENNLHRLFEKNSHYLEQLPVESPDSDCIIQPEPSEHIKRFIARFLLLTDIWYFNKKIPHIYDLCHQTNVDLQECMAYFKPLTSGSVDTPTDVDIPDNDSTTSPAYLSHEVIFKIVSICLLCIHKLQAVYSQHVSNIIPFTLAVYSQLVQTTIGHIQEGILNFPLPPVEDNLKIWLKKNSKHSKRKLVKKRRRRKIDDSNSDQDSSDSMDEINSASEGELISDEEPESASSSDDEPIESNVNTHVNGNESEKSEKVEDGKTNHQVIEKSKRMETNDVLAIITDENLLPCIKVLNDWLTSDVDILKSCGKTTRSLLVQIVDLLNLFMVKFDDLKLKTLKVDENEVPLPEDLVLKNVDILSCTQINIDWNFYSKNTISLHEQALLRISKIISFGHFLTTINETGVSYDMESKMFSVQIDPVQQSPMNGFTEMDAREFENGDIDIVKKSDETKINDPKKQLMKMKHMGQLWLTAEVKDLESRVKGKASLSPYLVLDADALILCTSMVKQLVYSRKFIVLVPSAVVSALDDQKREKLEARDAIRWLETQFHQGNRFFRAQRPQERLPIPYIKYPKKKDKEMLIYIQIIECCHYLTQQQKGASNLVTLLLGNSNMLSNGENREISYVGLAKSAGVNLELITEFYSKWKKTVKGKR